MVKPEELDEFLTALKKHIESCNQKYTQEHSSDEQVIENTLHVYQLLKFKRSLEFLQLETKKAHCDKGNRGSEDSS
jgi:hypothetical protein